jgi:hypothetical protein
MYVNAFTLGVVFSRSRQRGRLSLGAEWATFVAVAADRPNAAAASLARMSGPSFAGAQHLRGERLLDAVAVGA